jgi:hypothetical protein
MVDLAYDWGLMGWGMRAIVIALAVALILVVLSPHVAVLKPVAQRLGLVAVTTQTIYVPVNHTVYVNRTIYINQTVIKYINQTVPVYINRTVYVSVSPLHVNYTCHLNIYIFQHNMTVAADGYTNANLSTYEIPSCNSQYFSLPFLAAIYSANNSVTAPSVYVWACYNGTYTVFSTSRGFGNNRINALPPIKPNPAWNGTWILAGAPPNMPPLLESDFVNAIPCNATVYVEK